MAPQPPWGRGRGPRGIIMIQSTCSSTTLVATGSFMAVALIAVMSAGAIARGEAGHSQLRLATASVQTMAAVQDMCTSRPMCANPQLQQPAVSHAC